MRVVGLFYSLDPKRENKNPPIMTCAPHTRKIRVILDTKPLDNDYFHVKYININKLLLFLELGVRLRVVAQQVHLELRAGHTELLQQPGLATVQSLALAAHCVRNGELDLALVETSGHAQLAHRRLEGVGQGHILLRSDDTTGGVHDTGRNSELDGRDLARAGEISFNERLEVVAHDLGLLVGEQQTHITVEDLADVVAVVEVLVLGGVANHLLHELGATKEDFRALPRVADLLQEVISHVLDVQNPDILVSVHCRSDFIGNSLFIFASLLIGLRQRHDLVSGRLRHFWSGGVVMPGLVTLTAWTLKNKINFP